MIVTLAIVPVLVSILLAACGPRLGRALSGRAAAILLTSAAFVAALGTGLVLSAIAYLALAQWSPVAQLGHWSGSAVAARDPIPLELAVPCGLCAFALLSASSVRAVVSVRRLRRSVGHCRQLGPISGDLVIIDDPVPHAYALAGLPGRAVVTRSMLRSLSSDERRALLAHEAAHVRHHHYAYVQLTALAVAANPVLLPLVRSVRLAVERWADDDAAAYVGDRRLVATTLARATLAGAGSRAALPAGALGAAATQAQLRVAALLEAPVTVARRRLVVALIAGLVLLAAISAGLFGLHAHDVIEWAETVRTPASPS